MRHMFTIALLLLVSASTVSAQGHAQGHAKVHNNITTTNGVAVQPPPPVETPTTLTFYENPDMTGISYAVQIMPPRSVEITRVITSAELTSANLYGKVSAVKLTCGTRPSRVSLFDIDWTQSSSGTELDCNPSQTASINLQTTNGINGRNMNDKINAAGLVAHLRASDNLPHSVPLSGPFASVWATELQSDLATDGASPEWTQIWLEDFQDIHVQQALRLSGFPCSSRDAVFDIRINIGAKGFAPMATVYGLDSSVSYGFGDSLFGCHDKMVKSLQAGITKAAASIQSQFPAAIAALSGGASSSIWYFAPNFDTKNYDVFFWK